MARSERIKYTGTGVARYHLMSSTNDRRFLFERPAFRTELVSALKRAADFSGITLEAYAAMCNHFHVVVTVERTDEPVSEAVLLRRVATLKGDKAAAELAERWEGLRAAGFEAQLAEEQQRLRARMGDISQFMKTFKEVFDRYFKREQSYCGSIWSGRFKSTLIEDGEYLRRCMLYVYYNPIRAGIVSRAKDYAWSWMRNDAETEVFAGTVPAGVPGSAGYVLAAGAGGMGVSHAGDSVCGDDGGGRVEAWVMRRVAQIGEGTVFGSIGFVMRTAFALGNRFGTKGVGAHAVGDIGYSTHGWKLAKAVA